MGQLHEMESELDHAVAALARALGPNLHACLLYGSAVRGDLLPKASDLNLLIVLEVSTPEAHKLIAEVVRQHDRISPFVLGRPGLERSRRVFALKIRSIKRNYRVLHGTDVLADFEAEPAFVRFLCEQSLRNLWLRQKRTYITLGHRRERFTRYAVGSLAAVHTALSEALRCEGIEVPRDHFARLPVLERAFDTEVSVLKDLRLLKQNGRTMSTTEVDEYHARLLRLLTDVTQWMEARWPPPTL